MQIDQTKLTDNVVKNIANDNSGLGIENYIMKSQEKVGFFGNVVENYDKNSQSVSESETINMANATYQKPIAGEESQNIADNLSRDMTVSVEDRKNQMVVVSNTTTPEDYQKMAEDGFSFSNASSQTIITETDKIKAVLAKAGVDISIYGDSLSKEQLEEITGNVAVAVQIENKMKQQDIPVTSDNMHDAKNAFSQAIKIGELSDSAKVYMIKNHNTPTISNLYKAQFSGQMSENTYFKDSSIENVEFEEMEGQIKQLIESFGKVSNDENVSDAWWLIRNGLELNEQNMTYLQQLQGLSLGEQNADNIIDAMVCAIEQGNRPADAIMIDGFSLKAKAENAMNIVSNVTDSDIDYVIKNGLTFNIYNLGITQNVRINSTGNSAGIADETNNDNTDKFDKAFISSRRILEETRLLMTAQANYSLLKRGISIDTKPLEELVNDLKQQEKQYYADLMQQNGIEVTDEKVDAFSNVMSTVEETKWQPAYAITINSADENINTLNSRGAGIKNDFQKANERYETMMTAPRVDLGDNIRKAFRNIDDILNDLGIEATKENKRAIRILAYNETEINIENIAKVKAADEEVQRTFKNMTPAVVLEMIREGIEPLDVNISQLNEIANQIKENIGDESAEKYNKFLWKLEKNNKITAEERESYIGIYRLFAQIEKTDGASIGTLINQGSELTMRNLLTFERSRQKGNMDYKVDDDFFGIDSVSKGVRIDDQIMTAYNKNCVRDIMDMITPDKLEYIMQQDWENMTPEQIKNVLEQNEDLPAEQELDKQYASEQLQMIDDALSSSEDVYRYLDRYDIQNSVINIIAVNRMINNPNIMLCKVFDEKNLGSEDVRKVRDIKEQILERFSEAIKTPEELADAQEALAEVATHAMDNMIIEDRNVSSIDIKEMQLASRQLKIAAYKAKEESFVIPVETDGGMTGISLKVIRGKKEKGLVDIFFSTDLDRKVAASFEAKDSGISGMIVTSDEETRKLFADNLGMIVSQINSNNQKEAIDITVACVPDISPEQFMKTSLSKEEKAKSETEQAQDNPIQTSRLYNIAESFIKTVVELNNIL